MNKETFSDLAKAMSGKQKLVAFGIIVLLSLGAFGAMSSRNKNGILSNLAESVGLKEKKSESQNGTTLTNLNTPNGPMQLSKEYVYAGSRMLSVEDYGIAPANPSPTPAIASGNGGNGGNPTPTPTLTPTPPPDPNTGCPYGYSSLGGVIVTNPTAEVVNGRVVVFATGTDHRLYYQHSTGGAFSGWNVIQYGGTYEDPMSTVINSAMYMEVQGGDGNRYYVSSTDGMNFTSFVQGSVNAYVRHPSAVLNGQTYNFVKGVGSQAHLCVQVTAGGATPTPTPTPTPGQLSVTLTATPTSLNTGGVVTVNWSANQTRPNSDYIGVYVVGAPNNSPISTQNITGGTSGSTTVVMSTAGSYEFRYFVQGNPNPVATSSTVTVTAPSCQRENCPSGYFWNAETCMCEPI